MILSRFFKDLSSCSMEKRLVETYTDDAETSQQSIMTIQAGDDCYLNQCVATEMKGTGWLQTTVWKIDPTRFDQMALETEQKGGLRDNFQVSSQIFGWVMKPLP